MLDAPLRYFGSQEQQRTLFFLSLESTVNVPDLYWHGHFLLSNTALTNAISKCIINLEGDYEYGEDDFLVIGLVPQREEAYIFQEGLKDV